MIIKVVPNVIETSSVEQRVHGVSDYIHNPKPARTDCLSDYIHQLHPSVDLSSIEKCVYSNSRNFLDDDPQNQKLEMSQTASLNSKVIDPIVHIIGSFKKFEVPTIEQLEEQIDIISKHLGAKDLQMQYAMHMDTDNVHYHLIINKVHPFLKNKHGENKVIDLGEGWIHKSLHRAIAEIEAKQAWEPEPNSMYIYDLKSKKCNENPNYIAQPDAEKVSTKIRDQEHRHQQKSDITTGISHGQGDIQQINRVIQYVLNHSDCWQKWHEQLASYGIYYEKKRNGAIFNVKFGQHREQTFKASLFCNKATTLKNLEKKWGDFETSMMPVSNAIFRRKSVTSIQHKFNDQHPYHLFEQKDFLVKDLHDQYLKLKDKKDSITSSRKFTYQDIKFENEIYQNNKKQWLKSFKEEYPDQSTQTIFTLLYYRNRALQTQLRQLQKDSFGKSHEKLSQEILQDKQAKLSFLPEFSSSKITSYADFLKYISPLHHLSIQQQFLFDQRQSRNFIRQDNPEIKTAKIIYDQHQPNQPIAIQNQYGILVFSNYSVPRLYQCMQHLNPNTKAILSGLPEFKGIYAVALQSFENGEKLIDINEKIVLPSFKNLSKPRLEACFNLIFKKITSTNQNQSTSLVKTCVLLNCCGIDLMELKSTLKNCVDQNIVSDLNVESQKILLQRVNNLIQTQSTELNKQYFNSIDIEYCWELYLNLESAQEASVALQDPKDRLILPPPKSNFRLIPKNESNTNHQRSESLSELDFLQIQQYFEYRQSSNLKKKKENKLSNTLDSQDLEITEDQNQNQKYFSHNKYVIEYKFGHKFYLEQKQIAFFERGNSPEITVVSDQKKHIEDALLLALDKFGSVLVSGTDDFKRKVQEIAQLAKIEIKFDIPPIQKNNHVDEEESANRNIELVDESVDSSITTQIPKNKSINDCNINENKDLEFIEGCNSSLKMNDPPDFCL